MSDLQGHLNTYLCSWIAEKTQTTILRTCPPRPHAKRRFTIFPESPRCSVHIYTLSFTNSYSHFLTFDFFPAQSQGPLWLVLPDPPPPPATTLDPTSLELEPLQRNQRKETDTCFREKAARAYRQRAQSGPTLVRDKRTPHRDVLGVVTGPLRGCREWRTPMQGAKKDRVTQDLRQQFSPPSERQLP